MTGLTNAAQRIAAAWRFLFRRRGDQRWDLFLRAAGLLAALGVPVVVVFPRSIPLVWLAVLSVPANSPLSPVTPAAFEPLIMEAGKHASMLSVTMVALVVYLYMEYLNWHVYGWMLSQRLFDGLRTRRWVHRSVEWFGWAPFWSVVVFALTPLPFWAVRVVALLGAYPLPRFMIATAVGRFPRILFYAWVGAAMRIPAWVLLTVLFGTAAVMIGIKLARHEPVLADPVLDADPADESGSGETDAAGCQSTL